MRKNYFAIFLIVLIMIVVAIALYFQFFYNDSDSTNNYFKKAYIGKSKPECARIKFVCANGLEYFEDDYGCGCQTATVTDLDNEYNETESNYCTPESRNSDVCIEIYKPVCGWNDPSKIQCIRYPCAQTYSNDCQACANENVLYWTDGECPK